MATSAFDHRIATMRRFNRFYTQKIGVLQEGLLRSPFSLAEARVLYELAHREAPTASELARELGLDAGYLSRILRGFARRGLVDRRRSSADARRRPLSLTRRGRAAFAPLDRRSAAEIGALLKALSVEEQDRLIGAMKSIERLLSGQSEARPSFVLRPPRPGDIGWVIARHGALYAAEYGWDASFEAFVARIAAAFVEDHDPGRERCWIAELDGEPVGAAFLVAQSRTIAKLRMLIVEPRARGLGIGARLVEECLRFARQAGYRKITLWTNSVLTAARHLYERAGFRLIKSERHRSFGRDLIGEYWERAL